MGRQPENETTPEANEPEDRKEDQTREGGKQLKEIWDGTARIGHSIGQAFKGAAEIFQGRDYVVMVRVNKNSIDRIDQLVESGLFKSRSESAAFLIARGIDANSQLFDKIDNTVSEIGRLKGELQELIGSPGTDTGRQND